MLIELEANAVFDKMRKAYSAAADPVPVVHPFLEFIKNLIMQLLGGGGLGFCSPTPKVAQQHMLSPGLLIRNGLKRTIRRDRDFVPQHDLLFNVILQHSHFVASGQKPDGTFDIAAGLSKVTKLMEEAKGN